MVSYGKKKQRIWKKSLSISNFIIIMLLHVGRAELKLDEAKNIALFPEI